MGCELWKRLAMVQALVGSFGLRGTASLLMSAISTLRMGATLGRAVSLAVGHLSHRWNRVG